jgi:hypothetical protein
LNKEKLIADFAKIKSKTFEKLHHFFVKKCGKYNGDNKEKLDLELLGKNF